MAFSIFDKPTEDGREALGGILQFAADLANEMRCRVIDNGGDDNRYDRLDYIGRMLGEVGMLYHGVEHFNVRDDEDRLHTVYYINRGDPYSLTLHWSPISRQFDIGAWGDLLEFMEGDGWKAE